MVERADTYHTPETEQKDNHVVRVLPVAPISIENLQHRVRESRRIGIPLDDMPLCEILLAQKSGESAQSPNLIMPPGGEMGSDESVFDAGIREMAEETNLIPLSSVWARPHTDGNKFFFRVNGAEKQTQMHMITIPVRSKDFSLHEPTFRPEDKIKRLVAFSPAQLEYLISTGTFQFEAGRPQLRAAGHFMIAKAEDITISDDEINKRSSIINHVLADIDEFDTQLKEALLYQVNLNRQKKNIAPATMLDHCKEDELTNAFFIAQITIDAQGNPILPVDTRELLRDGNYVSASPERLRLDIVEDIPPGYTRNAVRHFIPGFKAGVRRLLQELDPTNPQWNSARTDPKSLFTALRQKWPILIGLPVDKTIRLLHHANDAMVMTMSQSEGFTPEELNRFLSQIASRYHLYITESLRSHPDFAQHGIFQEYRPRNELTNKPLLFTTTALAMGFDPDRKTSRSKTPTPANRRLPFEAFRMLAEYFVRIDVERKKRTTGNELMRSAINRFFQPELEDVNYVSLGRETIQPLPYRVTKEPINGKHIYVESDEREPKTDESMTRKAFMDPDCDDIYSINLIVADTNFPRSQQTINDHIDLADELKTRLFEFITKNLSPDLEWKFYEKPGSHKRNTLNHIQGFNFASGEIPEASGNGKRPGSKGDRILRDKSIWILEGSDGTYEKLEVNVYPFESSHSSGVSILGEKGYWGFNEKVEDDSTGIYNARRLMDRDAHNLGQPSFIEDTYPPHIYPPARRTQRSHVQPRKTAV